MKNLLTILNSNDAVSILLGLDKTGELTKSFPELVNLKKSEDEGGHKDNFVHTLNVLQNAIDFEYSAEIKLTALFHDLGKFSTMRKVDKKWTFHDHENVSARMVKGLFERFELPMDMYDKVHLLVKYHGQPKNTESESAVKRLGVNLGEHFEDLIKFCKCDLTSKYESKNDRFREELDALYKYKLEIDAKMVEEAWRPSINANDIMNILGINDGRAAGKIKDEMIALIKNGDLVDDSRSCSNWVVENYLIKSKKPVKEPLPIPVVVSNIKLEVILEHVSNSSEPIEEPISATVPTQPIDKAEAARLKRNEQSRLSKQKKKLADTGVAVVARTTMSDEEKRLRRNEQSRLCKQKQREELKNNK